MSTKEILKQAADACIEQYQSYVSNITGSCIASMVRSGIEFEKAASLANEAVASDQVSQLLLSNIEVLQKAASVVGEIETGHEKAASEANEAMQFSKMEKLASAGFSKDEIDSMLSLPENVIEKIASTRMNESFDLGSAGGLSAENVDPILAFCMGGAND